MESPNPLRTLKNILLQLVDEPDELEVQVTETTYAVTVDILVADSDVGKVLGRKGAHPIALRVIFGAIYGKLGKQLNLQVVDPRRR